MSQSFTLFVVDDDPLVLELVRSALADACQVRCLDSAERCLEQLAVEQPDFVLLDIGLPGIDGYSLCRAIKDDPARRRLPVTFISAHDTIDDRLRAYDAGGDDFIVKPFAPEELQRKLRVAQEQAASQRALTGQLEDAELLSSLVMASMDETGILLQFMSKLIAMESTEEIAHGALELMQRYALDGVVQTRRGNATLTLSAAGRDVPLEVAVIEHLRHQGRIFEFRRRAVHNFERVTLMINNLPIADPDFCGRLRDHLSVAAQGIDSRLKALAAEEANRQVQRAIGQALADVGATITALHSEQQGNAAASSKLVTELHESLLNSFFRLGLSQSQEEFLQELVTDFMKRMITLLNHRNETQQALQRLNGQLAQLCAG